MKLAAIVILFLNTLAASAQLLKGKVFSTDNRRPVEAASVFLATTSIGTTTNAQGEFIINRIPTGNYDLVVSCVGYETYKRTLHSKELPLILDIEMKPKVETLQEVIVGNNERGAWEKWGNLFIEHFIGTSLFAEDVKILNKETLLFDFSKKDSILHVIARSPLLIENRALGYLLKYDLTMFEYDMVKRVFVYGGFPFFEKLKPRSAAMEARWIKHRKEAYEGSLLHFTRSLYNNSLAKEGFEVRIKMVLSAEEKARVKKLYEAVISQQNGMTSTMSANEFNKYNNADSLAYFRLAARNMVGTVMAIDPPLNESQLTVPEDSISKKFYYDRKLEVRYPAKKFPREYGRSAGAIFSYRIGAVSGLYGMPVITDLEFYRDRAVTVFSNGSFANGINLMSTYYWSWWEKMANLLPYDYEVGE